MKRFQKDCAVLLYRDMEYNLIPVNGKNPPCVCWKRWESQRVPVEMLVEWSRRSFRTSSGRRWQLDASAALNWAIPTGLKPYSLSPAVVVVDSDDALGEVVVASRCPPTPAIQRTPGGGWHRVYRRPTDLLYIPIRRGTVIDGVTYRIDLRADHGYFMAPGSTCPKRGTQYRWLTPWSLQMFQGLPVYDPGWLPHEQPAKKGRRQRSACPSSPGVYHDHAEAVSQPWLLPLPLRIDSATRYLEHCPGSAQGRGSDDYCFALAMCLCWGFALPADDAIKVLHDWGQKETNVDSAGEYYPWLMAEIVHKVDNAAHRLYEGLLGERLDPSGWLADLAQEIVTGQSS